jgi:integrase
MPKAPTLIAPAFGAWLRQQRGVMSRDDLGQQLRAHVLVEMKVVGSAVAHWERGVIPPWSALAAYAAVYGIPLTDIAARLAWVTACQRVLGRRDVSPYALRHAFAARVYAASGDLHAVGALLLHSSSSLTARYALAAVPDRLRKAVDSTQRSTQTAVSC